MQKPAQKDLDKNVYPHIIACGPSVEGITHFFIAIENHLISVSFLAWFCVFYLDSK